MFRHPTSSRQRPNRQVEQYLVEVWPDVLAETLEHIDTQQSEDDPAAQQRCAQMRE